jgi:hypothetical protein
MLAEKREQKRMFKEFIQVYNKGNPKQVEVETPIPAPVPTRTISIPDGVSITPRQTPKNHGLKIINLTGHPVNFKNGKVLAPEDSVRAIEFEQFLGETSNNIPLYSTSYAKPTLPEPGKNRAYIVSTMLAKLYPERSDLLVVYKVTTNSKGEMTCKGLIRNPYSQLHNKIVQTAF